MEELLKGDGSAIDYLEDNVVNDRFVKALRHDFALIHLPLRGIRQQSPCPRAIVPAAVVQGHNPPKMKHPARGRRVLQVP